MARQTFRANLSASQFPLLSSSYGRSVVLAQQDMHYIRPNAFTGLEADHNIGIPQVLYVENVMPSSSGFQSVGFSNPIPAGSVADFDQAFYLRDAAENRTLFVPGGGKCYLFDPSSGLWGAHPQAIPPGSICSVASLVQRTFVCFSNHSNFLEWVGGALVNVTLTGLNPLNIRGVTTGNGVLVAWDYTTIYWSSFTNPTDFVPSLSTGAGSENILGLKGRIIYCKQVEDGVMIHTTAHCVIMKYTGNIRFPWVFNELKGSSGIGAASDVCDEPDGTDTYVYGNDGLMVYSRVKGQTAFPQITEFLTCGMYETYNRSTQMLDLTTYTARLYTQVTFVGSRWLVISYGNTNIMKHALIYDTALKRWGKITTDHVDCFEYYGDVGDTSITSGQTAWAGLVGPWNFQNNPWTAWGTVQTAGFASNTTPYKTIGFLAQDGKISVVDFNFQNTDNLGVLYLGKFQFIRARLTTVLDVEAEGVSTLDVDMKLLTSYAGRDIDVVSSPRRVVDKPAYSKWQTQKTGTNHTLLFTGGFQLNTITLRTKLNGER
jgi:hypothetical protein